MQRSAGFSLVELMIVLAVVAVIAALAIPSLMNSRKSANEASAIGFMEMAVTVNEQYRTRFGTFPSNEVDLFNAGLIEFRNPAGYFLSFVSNAYSWYLIAFPLEPGKTGDRSFYVDPTGVIRFDTTQVASSTSPPIEY